MKRVRETNHNTDPIPSMKKLKITTDKDNKKMDSPSKATRSKKGHHFLTACLQVLTNEYYDVKTRLELPYVPDCDWINNVCTVHNQDPLQVLSYEQEAFKIDIKSGMWTEALDVLKSVIKYNQFPSVDMMCDVVQIILCTVEEKINVFSDIFVVKKCQNLFKKLLDIHPPCVEIVRTFYKEFLLCPLRNYENCIYYKEVLSQKDQLLKSIISMLDKDLNDVRVQNGAMDCQTSTENYSHDKLKFANSIDDLSMLERLDKSCRMRRLFIILDILIDLLERDLAIWIRKYFNNPLKHVVRSRKPIIVWLIWQSRLQYGMVNNYCRDIFKFACDLMKSANWNCNTDLGMRLINILYQTFYLCGDGGIATYPKIGNKCETFANALFHFIKSENVNFILKFITMTKPKEIRYLLSVHFVTFLLKSPENNFILLANTIFKTCLWKRFKMNSSERNMKDMILPQTLYVKNFLHHAKNKTYAKLGILVRKFEVNTQYIPSSLPEQAIDNVTEFDFINIYYLALWYYSDSYNLDAIMMRHDDLCSNDEGSYKYEGPHTLLPLSSDCLKQYRLIVKTKKEICERLEAIREEDPFVYDLFKKISLFQ